MIYNVVIILFIIFKVSYGISGVFWHICDIHLDIDFKTSHQNRGDFGNYFSDSSFALMQSAFVTMKSLHRNPSFIIWNGDNVAHGHINYQKFLDTIDNVTQQLQIQFNSTEILPTFGNHDINPPNNISDMLICNILLRRWKRFLKKSEETTFKKGCFYSRDVQLQNKTKKVIVLNTVIWYSANKATIDSDDPYGQFLWMKEQLEAARHDDVKVFIVGHVPPGASEYSPHKYRHLYPKFNEQFLAILQSYSDIIEAGFFSHQHTDSFKVVYSPIGNPVIPLFLSPSVSPLHLRGLGSVNPSIRLYTWEASRRLYSQYHTTLPPRATPEWTLEYNSTDTLPSLSAASLDTLLTDLASPTSSHFLSFFRRHLSGMPHDRNETCLAHSLCRCQVVCGMRHIDYRLLDECLSRCGLQTARDKSVRQVPLIILVIVVFTLVLVVTVVAVNKVYCRQRRSASLTRDIFMATYNGKDCEQVVSDHIDNIAEITFGDVPEYRGHIRNNSRTILTLNDGNEIVEKSQPSVSKFALSSKSNKSQEKYDYSRM